MYLWKGRHRNCCLFVYLFIFFFFDIKNNHNFLFCFCCGFILFILLESRQYLSVLYTLRERTWWMRLRICARPLICEYKPFGQDNCNVSIQISAISFVLCVNLNLGWVVRARTFVHVFLYFFGFGWCGVFVGLVLC